LLPIATPKSLHQSRNLYGDYDRGTGLAPAGQRALLNSVLWFSDIATKALVLNTLFFLRPAMFLAAF